jgi:hypothetical protein
MKAVLQFVVGKLICTVFALSMLYGFLKFTMWMWPEGKWQRIAFGAILALDYALIISGIAEGLWSWIEKENIR